MYSKVSEPVQALPNIEYVNTSTSTQWAATADSKTIVSVLVSVAALLLIFAIVGFILYKVKNHVPDVLRRVSVFFTYLDSGFNVVCISRRCQMRQKLLQCQ